jgi:hypothetical protein
MVDRPLDHYVKSHLSISADALCVKADDLLSEATDPDMGVRRAGAH